jgi:hypothetical protein
MSEIPDDIWKAAEAAAKLIITAEELKVDSYRVYDAAIVIANAILAERQKYSVFPMEAVWTGDDRLPDGSRVEILACDPEDPSVSARMAIWIRRWPKERDFPVYRSCDLSDVEILDEASSEKLYALQDAILSPAEKETE